MIIIEPKLYPFRIEYVYSNTFIPTMKPEKPYLIEKMFPSFVLSNGIYLLHLFSTYTPNMLFLWA